MRTKNEKPEGKKKFELVKTTVRVLSTEDMTQVGGGRARVSGLSPCY
jgi:hypothetical protein